jgi:hypothetical protein
MLELDIIWRTETPLSDDEEERAQRRRVALDVAMLRRSWAPIRPFI